MKNIPQSHLIAEKTNSFVYNSTVFNEDGWADAKKYRPIPFDLVTIQTETGKNFIGWWNTLCWQGLRLRKQDHIKFWKRRMYEQIL